MGLFKTKQKGSNGAGSKDSHLDMTGGSIWRNMVAFAVPVFLGQLFQQLYNTADSIIVGNFSGKGALAAVSSSGNLIFMMTGFFMSMSICGARKNPRADMSTPQTAPKAMFVWTAASMAL